MTDAASPGAPRPSPGRPDPTRPADDEARALLQAILGATRHAVLGCLDPAGGGPLLSRIALQQGADGVPLALLSGLARHTVALRADPRAGLLVAPPPGAARGDAMARPRLSLQVLAEPLGDDPALRERWRAADPKAAAYVGLPDFGFWRMVPVAGLLNGGFGRAWRLTTADMAPPRG